MAKIKPFRAFVPGPGLEEKVAALPYDVYSGQEAREAVAGKPLSFLNIDRPETQFPPQEDMYGEKVYKKAGQMLEAWKKQGIFVQDPAESYYLYELTWKGRTQTGLVALSWAQDYEKGIIRRHENTREEKERDRIRHVEACRAHTGPVFLAYRQREEIDRAVEQIKQSAPFFDFQSEDGVRHRGFRISEKSICDFLERAFDRVPFTYIADGHHRAASAVKAALERRRAGAALQDESQYFLSVLFPHNQLQILPYNRAVKDLNGMEPEEFLSRLEDCFTVTPFGNKAVEPKEKGTFGLYVKKGWYRLVWKGRQGITGAVEGLDVSLLQSYVLEPLLGISDPRRDVRLQFVGGIRGTKELERLVQDNMAAAFSLYPTSMEELLSVADQGLLMPPKSTWFEPKLRSGLFLHCF